MLNNTEDSTPAIWSIVTTIANKSPSILSNVGEIMNMVDFAVILNIYIYIYIYIYMSQIRTDRHHH